MRTAIAAAFVGILGCASAKPVFYDNEKYRTAGREQAERDLAECRAHAEQAGATPGSGKAGAAAKNAGTGAVGGAAAGAVGGAIAGSPGVGAAAGAASGVVWGLFSSLFGWMAPSQPDPAYVNYVNMCLADRGYQVAGWK